MPAPFTIVTFTDSEGDEFPIRVGGWPIEEQAIPEAQGILDGFIKRDEMRPTEPVTPTEITREGLRAYNE